MMLLFSIPLVYSFGILPSVDSIKSDQVIGKYNGDSKEQILGEDQVIPKISMTDRINEKVTEDFKNIVEDENQDIVSSDQNVDIMPNDQISSKYIENNMDKTKKDIDRFVEIKKRKKEKEKSKVRPVVHNSNFSPKIDEYVSLPSGSTAKATLLGGIEVSTEERSIDARIDYAFLGPNRTIVELNGCIVWLKLRGNYNVERIYGEAYELSCRTQAGNTFSVPIRAHLKDYKDEYLGSKATLVTRGKVSLAALSFLKDGTEAFGKAMSMAQVSSNIVPGNDSSGSIKGENIKNEDKYALGNSVAGATGKFLNWWIDYYRNLSPTLAIAPGVEIFITIEGEVGIPKKFFEESNKRMNTKEMKLNEGESK